MSIATHKAELEAAGFTVAGDVAVINRMGIVVAEDHPHGFWSKSAEVDAILAQPAKVETKLVRARNEDGHFIADDPSTPDVNEAWVVKKVKKAVKKK